MNVTINGCDPNVEVLRRVNERANLDELAEFVAARPAA